MPRRTRFSTGGYVFHVLNRAAGRAMLFQKDGDYEAFLRVMDEARHRVPMRLLCYIVMPNHWHLVLWPRGDGDLSDYLHWLTVTHTQRWHAHHQTRGTGPLYQGRFKSIPIEQDDHFYRVCRYVERNALRANLTSRAELWRWSSLWQRVNQSWPLSAQSGAAKRHSDRPREIACPPAGGAAMSPRNLRACRKTCPLALRRFPAGRSATSFQVAAVLDPCAVRRKLPQSP